jgi:hypothetical protein
MIKDSRKEETASIIFDILIPKWDLDGIPMVSLTIPVTIGGETTEVTFEKKEIIEFILRHFLRHL